MRYELPSRVRQRATEHGEVGKNWIASLDTIVVELTDKWKLVIGDALEGGSESLVLRTERLDGTKAILKIGLPTVCDCANEAKVLRLANGHGYPQLFEQSTEHNAMLIEELGTPLAESDLNYKEQIKIVCETLQDAWIPLDESHGLTTSEEKAMSLAEFITNTYKELPSTCSEATIALALDYAAKRRDAYNPKHCVLVHGDAHPFNTLKSEKGYKFVDPDGLFAEPEFDLAIPMREGNTELLAGATLALAKERSEYLAALTGTDANAIWQWGFMERVSTGLLLTQLGFIDEGKTTLKVADRLSQGNDNSI